MNGKKYCVVGRHRWNEDHFRSIIEGAEGDWLYVADEAGLSEVHADASSYRYVFFLHWSHRIPDDFLERTECVCFHMTDVPYGRGGSPLQNLIALGHRETKLTALRMTADFDCGPVYMKCGLSLEASTAEEIFIRASRTSCELALKIAAGEPEPAAQEGTVVAFKRRKPVESAMPGDANSLEALFDHIRMLDCEGYPHAFLDLGNFRLSFRRASLYHDRLETSVTITARGSGTQNP